MDAECLHDTWHRVNAQVLLDSLCKSLNTVQVAIINFVILTKA